MFCLVVFQKPSSRCCSWFLQLFDLLIPDLFNSRPAVLMFLSLYSLSQIYVWFLVCGVFCLKNLTLPAMIGKTSGMTA